MKTSSKIIAGIVVILAVAFLAYWLKTPQEEMPALMDNTQSEDNTTQIPNESNIATNTAPVSTATFKDGMYSTTADYMSPGGKDSLGVTITLKGGNISAVTVKNMAGDRTSSMYQDRFIGGIKSEVVGKSIDSLKIGVVSGASLASNAFNKALVDVKAQASSN